MKKVLGKILCVFLVFAVLFSLFSAPAYAQEWTQTGLSHPNAWETVSHTDWETVSLEGEASFAYETSLANFSMWRFKLRLRGRAEVGDEADHVYNFFDQYVRFYIGNYPGGKYIKVEVVRREELSLSYWAAHSATIDVYYFDGETQVKSDTLYSTVNEFGDRVYQITIWRNTTSSVGIGVLAYDDWHSPKATHKTVKGEFADVGEAWFSNVSLKHEVYKGLGYGWCGGAIREEEFLTNQGVVNPYFSEEKTLAEQIADAIVSAFTTVASAILSAIPEPYRSFLVHLGDYAWFMVNIILALFGALAATAPVFLSVYGLYLLGLSLMCLNEATYQPLYDHFLTVYNFITSLMSRVIAFLQWLWNQIEVW